MQEKHLYLKFYGTRGSIPVSDAGYQIFGGNTACLAIYDEYLQGLTIIDAGTGIRNLGKDILQHKYPIKSNHVTLGFTHFHWDHIQGFPFFGPAYNKSFTLDIIAFDKNRHVKNLKGLFDAQMQEAFFPVTLADMGAKINFITVDQKYLKLNDYEVSVHEHCHPGQAYSMKIEKYGKSIVICTDIEHGDHLDPKIVDFAQGADILVHDAQYTSEELKNRKGWGHSSYEQALEMAERTNCKKLIFTHHDPDHDDRFLLEKERLYQEQFPNCLMAREGMVLAC